MGTKKQNSKNEEAVVIPLDLEEEIEEYEPRTRPECAVRI
jgi:hypothetical protein